MFCHELENIGFPCGTGSQVGGKLAAQYVRGREGETSEVPLC